jgi:hypothetical protein
MHVVPITKPLLGLPANLTLLALRIPGRSEFIPAEMVTEVLDNHPGFRNDNGLRRARTLHGDNRRFAQRVDLLELFGSAHVLAALEGLDIIRDIQLFKKP